ncbi:hypothetical protein RYH80_05630 [Halobaculum sp. MBLA0147]
MSSHPRDPDAEELPLICEFCGGVIEDDEQRCPALETGRCRP